MAVFRVLVFGGGAATVLVVLSSAVRTVVVPRGEGAILASLVVFRTQALFRLAARLGRSPHRQESIRARSAPTALMLLPVAWASLVIAAFIPMYWALGVESWREAFIISGSSLVTLGFAHPEELAAISLSIGEGLIGLGIIALVISFLPTIYAQFSRREAAVSRLEARAGSPPTAVELLSRAQRIGMFDHIGEMWEEWGLWFVDLEETHTSFPSLVWFRSPVPGRSWITAAGTALDTAALARSSLQLDRPAELGLLIRAGSLALRRVAAFFDLPFEVDPSPTDPIMVTRQEFDEVFERLAREQLPMKPDREQAWLDFSGWRVNYEAALLGLCGLIDPPSAPWSSDRAKRMRMPSVFRVGRPREIDPHRLA